MTAESAPTPGPATPVTSLTDPRAITLLTTEHWSLLTARSLAYNEAFVRGGMFLTFLSMSFVALALLAQGMSFGDQFLAVAAVVLGFDLVIGLLTYGRIGGANGDDLRAMYGMARIRHAYTEVAPIVAPYFTTAIYDDIETVVVASYGVTSTTLIGQVAYGLTTSGGMIGMITSMVGGVFLAVVALLIGVSGGTAVWTGIAGAAVVFGGIVFFTTGSVERQQAGLQAMFPAPTAPSPDAAEQ